MNTIEGRFAIVIAMLLMLFTSTAVHAAEQNYEIQVEVEVEVEGMRCAYCAYTVSKNLAALDGVVDQSVRVDLERGVATLQSTRALDPAHIKRTFLNSGFTVADISRKADQPEVNAPTAQVAKITLRKDKIGSKMANELFDVLGETAVSAPSEIHVLAPRALESDILKPLIAGRKRAIKDKPVPGSAVEVTLFQ